MDPPNTDSPSQVADDDQQADKSAAAAVREYAQDILSASGKKLRDLRGEVERATEATTKYVAKQPVQSLLLVAALSAALTALILFAMRSTRR